MTYVAIDPTTGRHLRDATSDEVAAYEAQPARAPVMRRPLRLGPVTIVEWWGTGAWYGAAGF